MATHILGPNTNSRQQHQMKGKTYSHESLRILNLLRPSKNDKDELKYFLLEQEETRDAKRNKDNTNKNLCREKYRISYPESKGSYNLY